MLTLSTLKKSDSLLALLLLALSFAATVAQDDMCNEPLMACLKNHVTKFTTSSSTAETCGILKDFSECISAIECISQQMREEIITNVTASFKTLVDCDQALDHGMPSVPVEGSGPEQSAADRACSEGRNNCTKSFVEKSFQTELHVQNGQDAEGSDMKDWFCPNLNEYLICLKNAPCEGEDYGETLRGDMESTMRKAGISCDLDALDGWTTSMTGGNTETDTEGMGETSETVEYTSGNMGKDNQEIQVGGEEGGNGQNSGEQAGATLTDPKDSAPSSLSGFSAVTVLFSLAVSLALLARH